MYHHLFLQWRVNTGCLNQVPYKQDTVLRANPLVRAIPGKQEWRGKQGLVEVTRFLAAYSLHLANCPVPLQAGSLKPPCFQTPLRGQKEVLCSQQLGPKSRHTSEAPGKQERDGWHRREARGCHVVLSDTQDKTQPPHRAPHLNSQVTEWGPCAHGEQPATTSHGLHAEEGLWLRRAGSGSALPGAVLLSFVLSSRAADRVETKADPAGLGLPCNKLVREGNELLQFLYRHCLLVGEFQLEYCCSQLYKSSKSENLWSRNQVCAVLLIKGVAGTCTEETPKQDASCTSLGQKVVRSLPVYNFSSPVSGFNQVSKLGK